MESTIVFLIAFVLGYLGFMGIIIFAARVIFPFLTKEELDRRDTLSLKK